MTGSYPAITDCAVTAAAMRAAAAIIEESGLPGLSVTCSSREIAVQVSTEAGTAAERAAQVGHLAGIAGTHAYRDDSAATPWSSVWGAAAAARDSRMNRARKSLSAAIAGASTFSATSRPSRSSRARNTTAIPPAPTCSSSR
jgi:hypothetical protein